MWTDAIIKETRELREKYAKQCNHNLDDIFADICERQKKSDRKCMTFKARSPGLSRRVA